MANQFGVSENDLVAIGYSPPAILTLFIVCTLLATLPFLLSLRKLEGNMVTGGCNSLVISAACHYAGAVKASQSTNWNCDR